MLYLDIRICVLTQKKTKMKKKPNQPIITTSKTAYIHTHTAEAKVNDDHGDDDGKNEDDEKEEEEEEKKKKNDG